jgi:hypothetical protein
MCQIVIEGCPWGALTWNSAVDHLVERNDKAFSDQHTKSIETTNRLLCGVCSMPKVGNFCWYGYSSYFDALNFHEWNIGVLLSTVAFFFCFAMEIAICSKNTKTKSYLEGSFLCPTLHGLQGAIPHPCHWIYSLTCFHGFKTLTVFLLTEISSKNEIFNFLKLKKKKVILEVFSCQRWGEEKE